MLSSTKNPYAPPGNATEPTKQIKRDTVPWAMWISVTAVSMILVTATALYLEANDVGYIDPGPHSAVVAGVCLAIASIWIGRNYRRLSAILLAEVLNLTVWLSMLLTVLVGLGVFHDQELHESDYRIIGTIWLGGAVCTAVIVLLSGRRDVQQPQGISNDN
jgi:hypothetical protein